MSSKKSLPGGNLFNGSANRAEVDMQTRGMPGLACRAEKFAGNREGKFGRSEKIEFSKGSIFNS